MLLEGTQTCESMRASRCRGGGRRTPSASGRGTFGKQTSRSSQAAAPAPRGQAGTCALEPLRGARRPRSVQNPAAQGALSPQGPGLNREAAGDRRLLTSGLILASGVSPGGPCEEAGDLQGDLHGYFRSGWRLRLAPGRPCRRRNQVLEPDTTPAPTPYGEAAPRGALPAGMGWEALPCGMGWGALPSGMGWGAVPPGMGWEALPPGMGWGSLHGLRHTCHPVAPNSLRP